MREISQMLVMFYYLNQVVFIRAYIDLNTHPAAVKIHALCALYKGDCFTSIKSKQI
jgi:hypothetical protein